MIKKRFKFVNVIMTIIGLLISVQAFCSPSKKDIQKLNNALIFDLFVNYELAEKNGNLVTIIDFSPNLNVVDFKAIKLTSNVGGENQVCDFLFNEKGAIGKINYEVNDKIYRYEFIYSGNQLASINIAGKPKIVLVYDKKGRLLNITREKGGGAFEYNFEYVDGENKANIKLIVIQGEKRSPSKRNYYVSWDSELKLESYYIDAFSSKNIKYTPKGDLLSHSFASVNDDNNIGNWEYSAFDEKQNWIERKSKDILFNRTIEYK